MSPHPHCRSAISGLPVPVAPPVASRYQVSTKFWVSATSVFKDDNDYVIERSGKSWPSWQTVALDKYLTGAGEAAGTIYVKIQGTDCQVREVVLEAGAEGGLRPVQWKTYQKSPSELIVYDARSELGIDDFGVGIVRRDGPHSSPHVPVASAGASQWCDPGGAHLRSGYLMPAGEGPGSGRLRPRLAG